jgi:N utilization substance protein A
MAKQPESRNIDFSNNSVRDGDRQEDMVGTDTLDRLDKVTGGEQPKALQGGAAREMARLNAQTEEEVDALRVNLAQDDDSMQNTNYGTGKIDDDLARDRMAGMTEVGPELDDKGVNNVVPGRDNTSSVLRSRHPNTGIARAQNVGEGNLDEPRDEGRIDVQVDEGTAA